jgi:hypothetical protein
MTAILDQKLSAKNQPRSQPGNVLNEDCENLKLIALARSFGAKETDHEEGVFVASFRTRTAVAMSTMTAIIILITVAIKKTLLSNISFRKSRLTFFT